ncbi:glutathione S-transferase family protein [Oceanibacterium hippocampi]|uniref:glutathione transferase n=1 Tax=Oceanibacterium hippocampi TaxID=745714 RepID=A0A1Y5RB12_9PROT|nr:glutathione S-transferase family protein [Oceanibacterium hippocampi]SLN12909.1 Stringent starvation protein A [Oceanibacterium hippocampi]
MTLELMSHHLCPYVQRAVIALTEKGVQFERTYIDLANKPAWFRDVSPLGKTPVLLVDGTPIFESAVILEYLEETQPNRLHPADPLDRARHRAWIEFGSTVLNDIAGFYSARDEGAFRARTDGLTEKFARLEDELDDDPWFAGTTFSLVDAVFGPVFRYFDTFETIGDFGILANRPRIGRWRRALAARPSIAGAVTTDYPERLRDFLVRRGSHLSALMT